MSRRSLLNFREEDQNGFKTYNHYLQAIESWCNWVVGRKRMDGSPLVGIPRLNAELDVRCPRLEKRG